MTTGEAAPPLPAAEAYRRWAETYHAETAVSALEDRVVSRITPPLEGRSLLDAGCGTGRRLRAASRAATRAIGVDLVPAMLLAGRDATPERRALAAGDLRALPLRSALFDVLWCRLVLGHLEAIESAYVELGRVARPGATLVVTDFHPAAAAAGHVRSFRDARGRLHTVVHHPRSEAEHARAAAAAGWFITATHHLTPGIEERPFYERAGRVADYDAQRDLPLVLALCLSR